MPSYNPAERLLRHPPDLPELQIHEPDGPFLDKPYSSADDVMTSAETRDLLVRRGLMVDNELRLEGEFLR